MKISEDEVRYVSELARLEIDNASIANFTDQLGKILEYVETLNSIDTEGVPATFHAISITNAFREDEEHNHLDRETSLANAPETDEGHFVVPKIIE
jgi:aspartyl-tRNA(Asn)/glutamyl-tRNA(Gln) amidotransferase subunit C